LKDPIEDKISISDYLNSIDPFWYWQQVFKMIFGFDPLDMFIENKDDE
jgi:hypothetical protein